MTTPPLYDDDGDPCPACGSPIDYCQGHGELGDPIGRAVLDAHDADDHTRCHPASGCSTPTTTVG